MDEITKRAFAAYFAKGDQDGTTLDQPSAADSGEVDDQGRRYVVLRNGRGVLAVYRIKPDGFLKRLRRWPSAFDTFSARKCDVCGKGFMSGHAGDNKEHLAQHRLLNEAAKRGVFTAPSFFAIEEMKRGAWEAVTATEGAELEVEVTAALHVLWTHHQRSLLRAIHHGYSANHPAFDAYVGMRVGDPPLDPFSEEVAAWLADAFPARPGLKPGASYWEPMA